MANDKDFTLKEGIEVVGSIKNSLGTISDGAVGFSIADAAYTSKSLSTPFGGAIGLTLGNNGTRVYVTKYNTPASIVQYNLSTAYDLSTSSDPSKSLNVSSQAPYPAGVYFKSDGSKVYTLGMNNDDVFQYSLSTPWDISTGSYDNVTLQESGLGYRDIYFKPDGTKMYIVCSTGADNIRQYALSTAWDLSTASYESKSLDVSAQETSATEGVFLSSDGTKAYTVGQGTNAVAQYNLTTPFDISTGSYSGTSFSVSSQVATSNAVSFSDDGTNMYVLDAGDGDVHQYTSSKTVKNVDLSTGNYFTHTPAGPTTYSFTNPGAVQSFQMQLTGGQEAVANSFNTTLYAGTSGSSLTINNGLNLSGDGGLVWLKERDGTTNYKMGSTDASGNHSDILGSNQATAAAQNYMPTYFGLNSNGFTTTNVTGDTKTDGKNYVSWSFKITPKFFDIVTYTGNGASSRTLSHNIGGDVGMVMIKGLNETEGWVCYHRSLSTGHVLQLNTNSTETNLANSIDHISGSTVTVTTAGNPSFSANDNNVNYVAYIFAHDTSSDSMIKCGSFTNDVSSQNVEINLGWKPQWLLLKGSSSGSGLGSWYLKDSTRDDKRLQPNTSSAEGTSTAFQLTDSGFTPTTYYGGTLIYVAIRSAAATSITYPSSVKFQEGRAPLIPATGETDLLTFNTKDSGTSYTGVHSIDNAS